jgi:DNA helicase II / ATP-dependent DNA helicase PcrA
MSALAQSIGELRENRPQWKAFETEGHCVVLAPPGSGKTKLLTTRLAFDLTTKILPPHGAACITLTNPAAEELRRRAAALGVEDRANLFIGTVHSFALRRVIEPFANVVGKPHLAKLSIARDSQSTRAYNEVISEVFGTHTDTRYVRSTIEFHRQRLSSEEEWARSGENVRVAARRYEEVLRSRGLMDFLDVVANAVNLVEDHRSVRRVLTAQYRHFYVDEYQDLAPGLDRLVRALCFDYLLGSELFAVGDSDQALYAFTGTRPELLHELGDRTDVKSVELIHNYRCAEAIIEVANRLRPGRTPMRGSRPDGQVEAVLCRNGPSEQLQRAAQTAITASNRGTPLHEIAILCPMNADCEKVAALLRAYGVSAHVRGSEYRLTTVTRLIEACAAWATLGREGSSFRLGDILRQWRFLLGSRWSRSAEVSLTRILLDYRDKGAEPARLLVGDLLVCGLEGVRTVPAFGDEALELAKMEAALNAGMLRDLSVQALGQRGLKRDRVEVTTMTSSKGLEFDVVILVGLDEGSLPHYLSDNTEKLAEDRRKFYVSITRARHELVIFYSGYVVTRFGRPIRNGPSRFLREAALI